MPKKKKKKNTAMHDALLMVSPGTQLREGIAAILQGGNGALICIGDKKKLTDSSEGGVELNTPFTPQLLYELSKMDGAIILNDDASKILFANRFLKPDNSIPSGETGTRHRAAERMAQDAKCTIIALSERRASVTLYVEDKKHLSDSIPTLLNKAMQAVHTLEKYVSVLNQATQDLSTREFQDMVSIFDVCRAIQRCEMVARIAREIDPFILELGTEGRLIDLQRTELVIPLEEAKLVIKDYHRERSDNSAPSVAKRIKEISQDELLNLSSISTALGYGANLRSIDNYLSPRGYRLLAQTHRITPQIIEALIKRFGSLQQIMRAPKEELCEVEGVGEVLADRIRQSLTNLRNQLALDRGNR
jgi:diadenylate cyclase